MSKKVKTLKVQLTCVIFSQCSWLFSNTDSLTANACNDYSYAAVDCGCWWPMAIIWNLAKGHQPAATRWGLGFQLSSAPMSATRGAVFDFRNPPWAEPAIRI